MGKVSKQLMFLKLILLYSEYLFSNFDIERSGENDSPSAR